MAPPWPSDTGSCQKSPQRRSAKLYDSVTLCCFYYIFVGYHNISNGSSGASVAIEYWQLPEVTAETFRETLRFGDVVLLLLYFCRKLIVLS